MLTSSSGESMPNSLVLPKAASSGGSPRKAWAWVRNTMPPKKMLIVASVMMKLCTPERTIA